MHGCISVVCQKLCPHEDVYKLIHFLTHQVESSLIKFLEMITISKREVKGAKHLVSLLNEIVLYHKYVS